MKPNQESHGSSKHEQELKNAYELLPRIIRGRLCVRDAGGRP